MSKLDIERLRSDLLDDELAMIFGADIPAGFIAVGEITDADEDELLQWAEECGFDLGEYEVD